MLTVRARAYTAILIITPDSSTETGVGASAWASGQPGVEGRDPGLGAEADDQEGDGDQRRPGRDQARDPAHLAEQQGGAASSAPVAAPAA